MMMMMIMNCFCGMVDRRKTFSLISSLDYSHWSSPSWISDTPQKTIWTCAEPEFRLSWMNLCSSDNHYTMAQYNQTHNLQTDEPTNTSAINFFLDFYLRNGTLYLFFFRLAYLFTYFKTSNYISHPLLHWFHSLKTSRIHCFLRFKLDSLDSKHTSCILTSKYLFYSFFPVCVFLI